MYLSAKDIGAMDADRRVHFLNERAIRFHRSLGDAVGMQNLGIHLVTVAPGDHSTEFHCHGYEEEAIYILSGTGTATIGDASQSVGPGDFLGFPANGVPHDMVNDGDEPLALLLESIAHGLRPAGAAMPRRVP